MYGVAVVAALSSPLAVNSVICVSSLMIALPLSSSANVVMPSAP